MTKQHSFTTEPPQGPANIFTYGSLMFPEVWDRVVRGRYRSAPAIVTGYARFAITAETYPGMVPAAGETVRGVVYFDVTPQDIALLDAFEGSDYRRDMLLATLDSGGTAPADGYIYLHATRLANAAWDPESFQMQRFLDTYCGLS
jgi:gamma-glutamylcyclotransferase (GGCT)/AIG2-like uncharacterized protein YtfP